jgi:transcriptional antiterminator
MSEKSAQFIKEFLDENAISITELAEVTNLSRFTIHKYLKGAQVSSKAARRIKKAVLEVYDVHLPINKLID